MTKLDEIERAITQLSPEDVTKLGAWFDRQPRTYAVSIRSSVGPRAGQRGPPCQKMTDDVHNPAVNWYRFHNRDGLVRRRMRFARM